jgi:hypothetical protein
MSFKKSEIQLDKRIEGLLDCLHKNTEKIKYSDFFT